MGDPVDLAFRAKESAPEPIHDKMPAPAMNAAPETKAASDEEAVPNKEAEQDRPRDPLMQWLKYRCKNLDETEAVAASFAIPEMERCGHSKVLMAEFLIRAIRDCTWRERESAMALITSAADLLHDMKGAHDAFIKLGFKHSRYDEMKVEVERLRQVFDNLKYLREAHVLLDQMGSKSPEDIERRSWVTILGASSAYNGTPLWTLAEGSSISKLLHDPNLKLFLFLRRTYLTNGGALDLETLRSEGGPLRDSPVATERSSTIFFTERDGTANQTAHYQSITSQQPYRNKSFEELRFEDYMQGRRYGNTNGQAGSFGQTTGSGRAAFGSNNTSAAPSVQPQSQPPPCSSNDGGSFQGGRGRDGGEYGVVQFGSQDDATTAIMRFQGYSYGGRPLHLDYARYPNPSVTGCQQPPMAKLKSPSPTAKPNMIAPSRSMVAPHGIAPTGKKFSKRIINLEPIFKDFQPIMKPGEKWRLHGVPFITMQSHPDGPTIRALLDTGACITKASKQWLVENYPDASIQPMDKPLVLNGSFGSGTCTEFATVVLLFPVEDAKGAHALARVEEEVHLFGEADRTILIGADIIGSRNIKIDLDERKAWFGSHGFWAPLSKYKRPSTNTLPEPKPPLKRPDPSSGSKDNGPSPYPPLERPVSSPKSPTHMPASPEHRNGCKEDSPVPDAGLERPKSSPKSPTNTPESPVYSPTSPTYFPTSPKYSTARPTYSSTCPTYSPTSPTYTPGVQN
ncbi:hypothetical protein TI39_contig4202g00009 [Zymoseptoria brevis]|uniref:Uncharacterized protein n=1 Tax=Zymoseptoria brevis TaxID=1047168 RepID=A0A0F4GAB3_9PEZI|nr:hypothetical protein TI39_contig4202g00009 [Zymoseptoria brevis]